MRISRKKFIFEIFVSRPKRELVIITSYPTRANGIIVLVNSQTGFCR